MEYIVEYLPCSGNPIDSTSMLDKYDEKYQFIWYRDFLYIMDVFGTTEEQLYTVLDSIFVQVKTLIDIYKSKTHLSQLKIIWLSAIDIFVKTYISDEIRTECQQILSYFVLRLYINYIDGKPIKKLD